MPGLLQQLVEQLLQIARLRHLTQLLDHLCKLHQLTALFGKRLVVLRIGKHLKQRHTQHIGNFLRLVHRRISDASCGLVDDAL